MHEMCVAEITSVSRLDDDGSDVLEEIFTEAFMMAPEVTDGSWDQKRRFALFVKNVAATFDVDGYRWLLKISTLRLCIQMSCLPVKGRRATERFTQAVAHRSFSKPHVS